MKTIEFEKMLSHKLAGQLCLRDVIYDFFTDMYKDDEIKVNVATKMFTDELFKAFVGDGTPNANVQNILNEIRRWKN